MGFMETSRCLRIGVDGFISRRGKRYGRDKVRPASTVDGDNAKIFAQRGQNGPKWTFYGVLGESFRGCGQVGCLLGELFRAHGHRSLAPKPSIDTEARPSRASLPSIPTKPVASRIVV